MPEPFRFECTLCGDCCSGKQVVWLSSIDLDLLVRRLNLVRRRELNDLGLVQLRVDTLPSGQSVWRPQIRFRQRPLVQCPFLSNDIGLDGRYRGLCTLHPEFKPLVCRLSPLTRLVQDDGVEAREVWNAIAPVEGCPGMGKGPFVTLEAPQNLKTRLEAETHWMRFWLESSTDTMTEKQVWDLLDAEVPA